MKRKICVFTSTRADYGLLYWTLRGLQSHPEVELQILCSGTHLCATHGLTYQELVQDGFELTWKCEMLLASDSQLATAKSFSLALSGYAEALSQLRPDVLVLLGDRFETLAAATAATLCKVPLAHCHGGELSRGAMDEAFRHAISKMSHLHFCCTAASRRRLLNMGEQAERVWQVSALGIENLNKKTLLERDQLSQELEFDCSRPYFLITYHPETLGRRESREDIQRLLEALASFPEVSLIFTLPNADPDNDSIRQSIREFVRMQPDRYAAFSSLGSLRYLSAMAHSLGVVGNSSSGILEAPALKVASLDIGQRQAGRERASSVLHCQAEVADIRSALQTLVSPEHRRKVADSVNPYGSGNASETIVAVLVSQDLDSILIKTFRDGADSPP